MKKRRKLVAEGADQNLKIVIAPNNRFGLAFKYLLFLPKFIDPVMVLFILLNIVSFLNTLLIILVVWYGFKLVVRFLAPKVIEKAAEKIVRDMNQRQNMQARPGTKNGDITVERTEKKSKQYQRNDGEYIDFEEIK